MAAKKGQREGAMVCLLCVYLSSADTVVLKAEEWAKAQFLAGLTYAN